ncbi:MAG TPA: DUF296 domain-containing protein [Bacillota bacterium]
MMVREFQVGRRFMARIDHDADLLDYLEEFAAKHEIKIGHFTVIGAVKSGVIGFFDQSDATYKNVHFDRHMEIGNCVGSFSLRDGKPAIHAHATLGDVAGHAYTGHLMEGTIIYAGELYATELLGEPLERAMDDVTKLALWKF